MTNRITSLAINTKPVGLFCALFRLFKCWFEWHNDGRFYGSTLLINKGSHEYQSKALLTYFM